MKWRAAAQTHRLIDKTLCLLELMLINSEGMITNSILNIKCYIKSVHVDGRTDIWHLMLGKLQISLFRCRWAQHIKSNEICILASRMREKTINVKSLSRLDSQWSDDWYENCVTNSADHHIRFHSVRLFASQCRDVAIFNFCKSWPEFVLPSNSFLCLFAVAKVE